MITAEVKPGEEDLHLLFEAIKGGNAAKVRELIHKDRTLLSKKLKDRTIEFDREVYLDAIKFIGAYIGAVTPLQLALIVGNLDIVNDIVERSSPDDLNCTFGFGNTTLHLAAFFGYSDVIDKIISLGADKKKLNSKGFTALDIMDNPAFK